MNDLLDDQLRTMMRTATADAPEAPSADDLQALTVVGVEPAADRRRPLLTVAAALLALGAIGALAFWPIDDAGEPADTPATTVAVLPGRFLDAYYLPAELPDGWQIVDSDRLPGGGQIEYQGDSAVFERRESGVRATVGQEPVNTGESPATTAAALDPATGSMVEPEPVATSAASATWEPEIAWLTWRQAGRSVHVTPSDGLETTARSIADDLVASQSGTRITFAVPDGSEWTKTAEYLLDGNPIVGTGANSLHLAADRQRTAMMAITRPSGIRASDIGTLVPGTSDIYVFPRLGPNSSAARLLGAVQVEAFSADGSVGNDELVALLASLVPVSEEEWLAARPDRNALVRGAAIVATLELLDHVVTVHREGAVSGVCIDRSDGVTGCGILPGITPDGELPPARNADGIALSDGTWVAIGSIPLGLTSCDDSLSTKAKIDVVPAGDVQVLLAAPAVLDEPFACSLSGTPTDGEPGSSMFIAFPPNVDD